MKMRKPPLGEPLNANERFLHGIALRLDILIEQMSSLVEHIAERDGVATTQGEVTQQVAEVKEPKKATRKKVK